MSDQKANVRKASGYWLVTCECGETGTYSTWRAAYFATLGILEFHRFMRGEANAQ